MGIFAYKAAITKTKSATTSAFFFSSSFPSPRSFFFFFPFVIVILELFGLKKPAFIWRLFIQVTANFQKIR